MGVGDMYHLFAAMLTMRPWDDITSNDIEKLYQKGTSSDNAMLRAYAHKYFKDVANVLAEVKPEVSIVRAPRVLYPASTRVVNVSTAVAAAVQDQRLLAPH